jgi:predicted DNA-binding transcriptional regulator AlpA
MTDFSPTPATFRLPEDRDVLTLTDLRSLLGISLRTYYRLLRRNELPPRLTHSRPPRFSRLAVEQWLHGRRAA